MRDKIREIVEGSSWYEKGEWGVRDAIRDTLVNAIYQATRLDEEKVADIIEAFDGNSIIFTSYDDEPSITKNGIKRISKKLCSQQDELTKE